MIVHAFMIEFDQLSYKAQIFNVQSLLKDDFSDNTYLI